MNNDRTYDALHHWVQRMQEGDDRAFDEIYQRCSGYVSFVCAKFCDNKEDAEEIVQDTFIIAFKKTPALQGRTLPAYLRTIAINECFRRRKAHYKKQSHVAHDPPIDLQELDEALLPQEALENKELHTLLLKEIAKLPKQQNEMMLLYYFVDFNAKQIAELMEVPVGSVYTALTRARQTIKRKLEAEQAPQWASSGAKALVLLPLAALFLTEETTYLASYIPPPFTGMEGAMMGTTCAPAGITTSTVLGYIAVACVAAVSVFAITAYVTLQSAPVQEIDAPLVTLSAPPETSSPLVITTPTPQITITQSTTAPAATPPTTPPPTEAITAPVTPTSTTAPLLPPPTPPPTQLPTHPPPTAPPIVDRTAQILAALATANTPSDVAHIFQQYDFTFDTQIETVADDIIRFYVTNKGSGDILVGTAVHADGTGWRMQYRFYAQAHVPQDRFELYLWMLN